MNTNTVTDWRTFFGACTSTDAIKSEYRRLARIHHPDLATGDHVTMQQLNAAYDAACRFFVPSEKPGKSANYYDWRAGVDEEIRAAIERIITLDGLDIEICGLWVWLGGNTHTHKEALKAASYKWSKKKIKWYFAGCPARGQGNWTMPQIRATYGSERVAAEAEASPFSQLAHLLYA